MTVVSSGIEHMGEICSRLLGALLLLQFDRGKDG